MSPPILPRPVPDIPLIPGRLVDLERLDMARHGDDLWWEIGADDRLWEKIPPGPFPDKPTFLEWLTPRADRADVACYAIVGRETRAALGLFLLLGVNPAMGTVEMGLVYGPSLARRTEGTEAFLLLGRYVLETLGYRRLEWRCGPDHTASRRAAERFGFTQEGILRQTLWVKGRSWDTTVLSLLDHEWPAVSERLSAWLSPDNFDEDGEQISALGDIK